MKSKTQTAGRNSLILHFLDDRIILSHIPYKKHTPPHLSARSNTLSSHPPDADEKRIPREMRRSRKASKKQITQSKYGLPRIPATAVKSSGRNAVIKAEWKKKEPEAALPVRAANESGICKKQKIPPKSPANQKNARMQLRLLRCSTPLGK